MTRPPSCLSELRFTSLLQYSPDGVTKASLESRHHVVLIKRGTPAHIKRIGLRGAEYASRGELGAMLGADVALVPVPRSQPLRDKNALWPAMRIAEELVQHGLGEQVRPVLVRREPIVKSALLRAASKRPSPEDHIRTISAVDALHVATRRIVLVDDVVTRGATLLACASVLLRVLPSAEVVAFAAVRTMSGREIDGMLAPVVGVISYTQGRLHREP